MSFTDNSQNSASTEQRRITGSLQLPGLVSQLSPADQLPFPEATSPPLGTPTPPSMPDYTSSPGMTRPFTGPITSPGITQQLPDLQTGQFTTITTTNFRQPIVIRGSGKKSVGTMRPPPRGHHWLVQAAVIVLFVFIALGTLMAVLPVGNDGHGFNPFRSVTNLLQSNGNSTSLIAQQAAATATAGTLQDGCETCNTQNYVPPPGSAAGDTFTYGQCTYYADLRYHNLTGYWIPWGGNAADWVFGARAYSNSGWVVSSQPHVPSIIVLEPGVEGAGGYGHVAIVERINPDGSVWTSNWNWWANGGGWARLSYWTFTPGPGVYFVWHV